MISFQHNRVAGFPLLSFSTINYNHDFNPAEQGTKASPHLSQFHFIVKSQYQRLGRHSADRTHDLSIKLTNDALTSTTSVRLVVGGLSRYI